jgi:hypothetical protein
MAVKIPFRNPQTDEIRTVKVGWSWTLFFFSNLFGLPLFLRRLPKWGLLFLGIAILGNILQVMLAPNSLLFSLSGTYIGLAIWMGLKGNEITAKAYLDKGWVFAKPESNAAEFARSKWNIAEPVKEAA